MEFAPGFPGSDYKSGVESTPGRVSLLSLGSPTPRWITQGWFISSSSELAKLLWFWQAGAGVGERATSHRLVKTPTNQTEDSKPFVFFVSIGKWYPDVKTPISSWVKQQTSMWDVMLTLCLTGQGQGQGEESVSFLRWGRGLACASCPLLLPCCWRRPAYVRVYTKPGTMVILENGLEVEGRGSGKLHF